MNTKLNWSIKNNLYKNLLIEHGTQPAGVIYQMLHRKAYENKDFEFAKNLTIGKVISQLKVQKYIKGTVQVDPLKRRRKNYGGYNKFESATFLDRETIKKSKQNTYLSRHIREEATISSTRDSIIECLVKKVEVKKVSCLDSTKNLFTSNSQSTSTLTLQHILTDIHVNEVTYRKGNKYNWDSKIALKTVIKIVDEIIKKQVESNGKYNNLQLLLLGDLIGTKIHEGLDIDIEPVRAAKFLASILAKVYINLCDYFTGVEFVVVPGNHSETRLGHEKNDRFIENFDFLVSQYLKEFLALLGAESKVISPCRDVPVISKVLGTQVHGFAHGDRYNTDIKKMLPLLSEYYNTKYIDFLHEGHFHNQKIRYEDGFLKMTYPCVTQTSFYGQNRFGALKREPQVGNIYNSQGELLETYYLQEENIEELSYLKDIKINLDLDLSEIFIDTIKYLSSK